MSGADRIYTLIAELTYRCPLRCPYCSNPLDFNAKRNELTTDEWRRVFTEAEELGALQVNLTGGEPLLRDDLELLVAEALPGGRPGALRAAARDGQRAGAGRGHGPTVARD